MQTQIFSNSFELMNKVVNGGGFSLNVAGESANSGYMVSKQNFETVIPMSVLSQNLLLVLVNEYRAKLGKNEFVGAWVDNDKLYLDISENVQDKDEAVKLGKERSQLGIFDLSTFETIYL